MLNALKETCRRVLRASGTRVPESSLPLPTVAEEAAIEELRRALRRADGETPSSSHPLWADHVRRFRDLVLHSDPREFLRWDVIRRAMFVGPEAYVQVELDYLRRLPEWESRWRPAIRESDLGCPRRYPTWPDSSGNLIHHAYHLARFETATGTRIDAVGRVFEVGGGYGSMCRLFRQLGFRGAYVMFDFPEFCALQRFYLRCLGILVAGADVPTRVGPSVLCVSDIEHLRSSIADGSQDAGSMFLATWSISEVPLELRDVILPQISSFAYFLVAYQHRMHELDNKAFFSRWAAEQAAIRWHHADIEHLPGSAYLIGARRAEP